MAAESKLEAKCREHAKARGCKFYKWVSPGKRGVADRILVSPGGVITFVETKAPAGGLSPEQARFIRDMAALGVTVHVIDTLEDFKALVKKALELQD
jgi:hypothetical protein